MQSPYHNPPPLGQFLCSRIGGLKRAISDRRPNRAFLRSRKSAFSIPTFSIEQPDPHIPSRSRLFNGMCGSDCSIEKLFEAHCISHQPTKHTITPYNSSDAGLTATVLLLLLLTTSRCATSCSSPASSSYRHPMTAVRVIDDHFATPLLQQLAAAVLSLATLDEDQRHNRGDEADEGPPCAKLFARGKCATKACSTTASSSLQTP